MKREKYTNAFNRLKGVICEVAASYGCSRLYLWLDALWAHIFYGVTPNQYIGWSFYAKSRLDRNTFYTARLFKRLEPKLNDNCNYHVFWDKQIFNKEFKEFVGRDWIYAPDASLEDIHAFINKYDKIIIKPTSESAGKGIHIYENSDSIEDLISRKSLLEEYIEQHPIMALPNPSSVNSVRVYTLLDDNGNPHILSSCMRVGGLGSATDNFHSGGVAYPIDIEHGIIIGAGADMNGKRYYYHPDSNYKMIGLEIPYWDRLVDFVFRAARKFPKSRMIAWDVAVKSNGFALLEGNYNGDPGILQTPLQKGLLPQIKKYMMR